MVRLKYRKYGLVSNGREYNMLWLGLETIIADIPCQKPNITELVIDWEYTWFGQSCDIQRIGMKFGAISEPEFAINQTLLKIHVSNRYHKGFCKMIIIGPLRILWPKKIVLQSKYRRAQIIFQKLNLGFSWLDDRFKWYL